MIRIIIVSIFLVSLISCKLTSDKQTLKTSFSTDTTLILKKNIKQGNVWGIDLKIIGNLHDTIILIHTNDDNVTYIHKLIGGIDTIYHSDWYSDSCLIKFENVKKPIKDLQIDYEFFD